MEDAGKAFTIWKLKWYVALTIGVTGTEIRVAQYLLQCCNAGSKRIDPGMPNIAHMLSSDLRSVERHAKKLVEMGVVRRWRRHRQESYRYEFIDEWMLQITDQERSLRREWKEKPRPE